ncbi:MAG: HAMP domain-containing histidine kinase [Saccharofermentans sp.]|nr:HAMP domain-containing histidine kinase [Saccharofermentans sp.]
MTKKKTVVPKKKAIRKPKYIKYFAIWLAIFLAVSMAASYFVINVCRQTARTKALSNWNSYTQELVKLMNDYCSSDEKERSKNLGRIRRYLCRRYGENMNEFCGAYVENKKIAETPEGACAGIIVNFYDDNEDEHDEVFFLESSAYLEPLYKSGKYDPVKNAYLIEVYSVESDMLKSLAERIGLMPAIYSYSYQEVYINRNTHTFLPGKILIFKGEGESASEEPIATIDCTPKDTKGYEPVNELFCYNGFMNPSMTDINDAQSITNDTEFDISYDMSTTDMSWEILTVPSEMYCNKACFKALPLTTGLVLIIAGLVALLLAVTVSSIIYSSKKAVWEIFEYRKKTTAAMAHDLKTPLAAMSAYAENLEYDIDSDKRAYYSSKVRENVAFMNKTIESILMFTKSETGTAKSVARDIDVHALIEAEYNAVAELFEKKNIKVEIKGEGHVKSNKELIDQAVRNLVGNATKYARPDTTVDIVIDSKGFTMTNLTDQKIKNVKDLKKPFVKGEESRDAEGGAGLGLSIVENCLLSAGHSLDIGFEDETFKAAVRW